MILGQLRIWARQAINVPLVLCIQHYALCTMYYAVCTMHYCICTMHYGLCNIPWQASAQNSLSHNATHWYEMLYNLPPNNSYATLIHRKQQCAYRELFRVLARAGKDPFLCSMPPFLYLFFFLFFHLRLCFCISSWIACTFQVLYRVSCGF